MLEAAAVRDGGCGRVYPARAVASPAVCIQAVGACVWYASRLWVSVSGMHPGCGCVSGPWLCVLPQHLKHGHDARGGVVAVEEDRAVVSHIEPALLDLDTHGCILDAYGYSPYAVTARYIRLLVTGYAPSLDLDLLAGSRLVGRRKAVGSGRQAVGG